MASPVELLETQSAATLQLVQSLSDGDMAKALTVPGVLGPGSGGR